MGKIKVNEIEKHDATEVTVNSDVVMAAGTSVSSPSISTDTISEKTSASGVTVDGVLLKDNAVNTDTISEKTSGSGVTIDGVLIKDGEVDGVDVSGLTTAGLVLVDSHSFSTQSSISRDNVFTSSYNNYLLHLNLTAVTNQGQVRMRLRASSTDNSSSNYNNILRYSNYSSSTFTSSNEGANPVTSFFFGYNSPTYFGNTQMTIINPQSSLYTQIAGNYQFVNTDGNDIMGSMTVNTSYDGFTIYPLNGTLSGELFVYGYREG